jgi:hypothetical protein
MSNYELTFSPRKKGFPKGHIPFNKGKKMSEYMSPKSMDKVLSTLSRNGNPNINTFCQKPVVCVHSDGTFTVYANSEAAARKHVFPRQKASTLARNIRHAAQLKRKRVQGMKWFFEDYFIENYNSIIAK